MLVVKRWPAELFPAWTTGATAGEYFLAVGHRLHRLRELSAVEQEQELRRLDGVLPTFSTDLTVEVSS